MGDSSGQASNAASVGDSDGSGSSGAVDGSTTLTSGPASDSSGSSSGELSTECTDVEYIEVLPPSAFVTGSWEHGVSDFGEGDVLTLLDKDGGWDGGMDGSVIYHFSVPCDDSWYIWVRYPNWMWRDSYRVALDGDPVGGAVFEGEGDAHCDWVQVSQQWEWGLLNQYDDSRCVSDVEPWVSVWSGGSDHQIEFRYRESLALGQILVTNSSEYVP